MVSKYSKVDIRYTMKFLTAPPGSKILSERIYLKKVQTTEKNSMTKLFSIIVLLHLIIARKHLAHKNDTIEKYKTRIYFFALNKTALAGNEAHLSIMLKMLSFSNNTHLDTGLNFSMYTVQHGK